jgi:hypothetical protein
VSYPSVWGAPKLEWLQWNGSNQNPIARNLGKLLIVSGHAEATVQGDDVVIRSTARVRNLIELEEWTRTLAPPRWPEEILGAIDRDKARKGEEIYRKAGCATCHADKLPYPETAPNKFGKTFTKIARTPLSELKTDPLMAENFLSGTAKTGKFARLFQGLAEVPSREMLNIGLLKLVEGDLNAAGLTSEEMLLALWRESGRPPPTCTTARSPASINCSCRPSSVRRCFTSAAGSSTPRTSASNPPGRPAPSSSAPKYRAMATPGTSTAPPCPKTNAGRWSSISRRSDREQYVGSAIADQFAASQTKVRNSGPYEIRVNRPVGWAE